MIANRSRQNKTSSNRGFSILNAQIVQIMTFKIYFRGKNKNNLACVIARIKRKRWNHVNAAGRHQDLVVNFQSSFNNASALFTDFTNTCCFRNLPINVFVGLGASNPGSCPAPTRRTYATLPPFLT